MSRLLHGIINYHSVTPGCSCPSNPVLTVLERHAPAHAGGCFEAAIDRFTPDPSNREEVGLFIRRFIRRHCCDLWPARREPRVSAGTFVRQELGCRPPLPPTLLRSSILWRNRTVS